MLRRLLLFTGIAAMGLVPAALAVRLAARPAAAAPPVELARAHALAIDLHAAVWLDRQQRLAGEVAGLLAQVPGVDPPRSSLGAAEGTIVLHLQRRLAANEAIGEQTVLAPNGLVLASTEGTRSTGARAADLPEVTEATERAVLLLTSHADRSFLTVAAPVKVKDRLLGVVIGRLTDRALEAISRTVSGRAAAMIDAAGPVLGQLPGWSRKRLQPLGSESKPGSHTLDGGSIVYAPLRSTRAVVALAPAPPAPTQLWRRDHLWLALGVLLVALIGAWAGGSAGRRPQSRG